MYRTVAALLLAGVAFAGLQAGEGAGEKGKIKVYAPTSQIKTTPVATLDFKKALDLGFDSLGSLGGRIDRARKDADPVGLAAAASELRVAEQVSGNTAKVTAADLAAEAVELAKMRNSAKELKAVSLLLPEGKARTSLASAADAAKKKEAEDAAQIKKGVRMKGLNGRLEINNVTGHDFNIIINGQVRGVSTKYADQQVYVYHGPHTNTVIQAHSTTNGRGWVWRINDNPTYFKIVLDRDP